MIFVLSLFIGGITPPVGMYLLIICGVQNTPIHKTFKYIIPFFLIECFMVFMIMFFPQIVDFLPGLLAH